MVVVLSLHTATAIAGNADILAADILTGAVPLTGLVVDYCTDDPEGRKQWLRNPGVNRVLTSALRLGFNGTRVFDRYSAPRH